MSKGVKLARFSLKPPGGAGDGPGGIICLTARDFFEDFQVHQAARRPRTRPGTGEIAWTQR